MHISYCTIYNFRPDELYGMGKESIKISGEYESLEKFMETLEYNSSIKHEDNLEWIVGTDEFIEREDWKPYIGQPMFYITDIKVEREDQVDYEKNKKIWRNEMRKSWPDMFGIDYEEVEKE